MTDKTPAWGDSPHEPKPAVHDQWYWLVSQQVRVHISNDPTDPWVYVVHRVPAEASAEGDQPLDTSMELEMVLANLHVVELNTKKAASDAIGGTVGDWFIRRLARRETTERRPRLDRPQDV